MDQQKAKINNEQEVDPGILEVVIAIEALSVAIIALLMDEPVPIIEFFVFPIVICEIIAFFFGYLAIGDLLTIYVEKGKGEKIIPPIFFRPDRLILNMGPYSEIAMTSRFFGLGLVYLVSGMILKWIEQKYTPISCHDWLTLALFMPIVLILVYYTKREVRNIYTIGASLVLILLFSLFSNLPYINDFNCLVRFIAIVILSSILYLLSKQSKRTS